MACKVASNVSVEELKRHYSYDPETGIISRRTTPDNRRVLAGDALGRVDGKGYIRISVLGKGYVRAHRLAWALHYGEWPDGILDHIDMDKTNNRISNLRRVSHTVNCLNAPVRTSNSSGVTGVSFRLRRGKWHARINIGGRKVNLGYYDTLEEAREARKRAEDQFIVGKD